ncbi:unnamed protein product [Amoebophrya sp. A25]|nr:unnamed protein product [Amoebophrya sp. A25]|eukprot:GSA25T00027111001.1
MSRFPLAFGLLVCNQLGSVASAGESLFPLKQRVQAGIEDYINKNAVLDAKSGEQEQLLQNAALTSKRLSAELLRPFMALKEYRKKNNDLVSGSRTTASTLFKRGASASSTTTPLPGAAVQELLQQGSKNCDFECAAAGIVGYFACAGGCVAALKPGAAIGCITLACPPIVAAATETCLKVNPECQPKDGGLQSFSWQSLQGTQVADLIHGVKSGRHQASLQRLFGELEVEDLMEKSAQAVLDSHPEVQDQGVELILNDIYV